MSILANCRNSRSSETVETSGTRSSFKSSSQSRQNGRKPSESHFPPAAPGRRVFPSETVCLHNSRPFAPLLFVVSFVHLRLADLPHPSLRDGKDTEWTKSRARVISTACAPTGRTPREGSPQTPHFESKNIPLYISAGSHTSI